MVQRVSSCLIFCSGAVFPLGSRLPIFRAWPAKDALAGLTVTKEPGRKSPFWMWVNHGEWTISKAIFNSYVTHYQRVHFHYRTMFPVSMDGPFLVLLCSTVDGVKTESDQHLTIGGGLSLLHLFKFVFSEYDLPHIYIYSYISIYAYICICMHIYAYIAYCIQLFIDTHHIYLRFWWCKKSTGIYMSKL